MERKTYTFVCIPDPEGYVTEHAWMETGKEQCYRELKNLNCSDFNEEEVFVNGKRFIKVTGVVNE